MDRVFTLKVDHSQSIDDIPNVHKISLEDYQDLSQVLASEKHSFSGNVVARANFLKLKKFDFITNDLNIPVLSRKMIDLTQIDKIEEIVLIPLSLVDDTYLNPFSKEDVLDKKLQANEEFYSLKFTKQLDCCNREFSNFRKLRSKPNELGILKKPVLNTTDLGFPDIFRIKESVSFLFVSERIKNIVELNDLKGCVFEEVETTPTAV